MTSQNILRNLLNENLKRRILVIVLSIYFGLMAAFQAVVSIQDSGSASGDPRELFFGAVNGNFIWVSAVIAAVCAVHGFAFLFSRVKTDFYYSLPVTKREVFVSVYLNGIRIYMIPCLLYHVILAAYGYVSGFVRYSGTMQYMFLSFFLMMAGYLLIYHVVMAVVMICGNLPAAAGLTVFVMAFGKLISIVANQYSALFFSTYYNSEALDAVLKYISPVKLVQGMMWTYSAKESSDWTAAASSHEIGVILAGLVIAGILSYQLYKAHPAEGAGQAVVFQTGQRLISAVLVVTASLLGGLALMSLSLDGKSMVLMIVGILLTSIAVHGALQMIYYSEVRAFFRNRLQMTVICALSLLLAFGFRMDITGYDRFVLRPQKIESMAVSIKGLSDLYAGSELEKSEKSDGMSSARLSNMELTGDTKNAACRWIAKLEKDGPKTGKAYSYASVLCRMEDGRRVYRRYYIPSKEVLMQFAEVFESEEYQKGEWPILRDGFAMQKEVTWSNGVEKFTLNLREEEKKEFLNIYRRELTEVRMEEITKEVPTGTITLTYGNSKNGEFSFLYPAFQDTNEFLKAKGIPVDRNLWDYEALEIAVRTKAQDGSYKGQAQIYEDPEENKQILKTLLLEDYNINPLLCPVNQEKVYDVKLRSSAGDTVTEVRCVEKQ